MDPTILVQGRQRRRWSKALPPDLADLMDTLIKLSASFIREFEEQESWMREIVETFRRIADEVREMQKKTDDIRRTGVIVAVATFGLGGLFTVGSTVYANSVKISAEKRSKKEVESKGKEFMEIVKPLKEKLEEIKTTCEKLENRSAELQAELTLSELGDFQTILERVIELKEMSAETVTIAAALIQTVGNMLMFIVAIFRFTVTPEQDKKLTDSIIQSADQCEKVTDSFDEMSRELRRFFF